MTDYPEAGSIPDPGVYPDVPDHVYHSWDAASNSTIKPMDRSPAHAYYEHITPKESPTLDMGNALHSVILEPDKVEDNFSIRPPGIDGRTKDGKALLAEWRAESEGKILIEKPDAWDLLTGVGEAVLAHDVALDLVTGPGFTELSIVWEDPAIGIRCKARMDRFCEPKMGIYSGWPGVIVDLKGLADASPRAFQSAVLKWGYHTQAFSYRRGMKTLYPDVEAPPFVFLCVEKTPPYAIAIYELDMVFEDLGEQDYLRRLTLWAECKESGRWPGYGKDVHTIEAPEWAANRLEYGS